jgi:cobalt/nickel transport system permease protein
VRLRGFGPHGVRHGYRTIGTIIGSTVVRGQRRAEGVALAMRCRGFDGRFRSAAAFRTRPADVLFAAATILTAAALVAWDVT